MHEYSITCSILDILNKVVIENKIKKVKKINFEISPVAHIEPESIRFYFDFLTQEKEALKNAKLEFKKKKIEIECRDCKKIYQIDNFIARCPKCSGVKVKIIDSDDIKIISVEA